MHPPIQIYTDGSCHTQLKTGAWAAIILMNKEKIILQAIVTHTTHNRMELTAVIKAIEYVQTQPTHNQPMHIYSDSQYVVKLAERKEKLKQHNFTTKKGTLMQNADLVRILIQHIERENLLFIKVKAHQKQTQTTNYNREVDILVRKMLRSYLNKL
jgi:ribonuclease HI